MSFDGVPVLKSCDVHVWYLLVGLPQKPFSDMESTHDFEHICMSSCLCHIDPFDLFLPLSNLNDIPHSNIFYLCILIFVMHFVTHCTYHSP